MERCDLDIGSVQIYIFGSTFIDGLHEKVDEFGYFLFPSDVTVTYQQKCLCAPCIFY